jgi:hypothetical protein
MRVRFTLSQIMIANGIVGVVLAFILSTPTAAFGILLLVVPLSFLAAMWYTILSGLRLRDRLSIEFATLVAFLGLSAWIWWPGFYWDQEQRCWELASLASTVSTTSPETRQALDREAAWFRGRAGDLRRRGFWLGLTMGPKTRDDAEMARNSFLYEFATTESVDKHEARLRQLIALRHDRTSP